MGKVRVFFFLGAGDIPEREWTAIWEVCLDMSKGNERKMVKS
jgi:hypothetical protein